MKLMTKTLEKRFAEIGRQEKVINPIVVAKYFIGGATWYATEYNPDDRIFFGYVTGLGHDEWGYFSLDEFESVTLKPLNQGIERDLYVDEKPISEHCSELAESINKQKELQEIQEKNISNNELER